MEELRGSGDYDSSGGAGERKSPEKKNLRGNPNFYFQIQYEVTFISVTNLYVFSTKVNFCLLLFRSYEKLSTLFIKLIFKYIFNSCIYHLSNTLCHNWFGSTNLYETKKVLINQKTIIVFHILKKQWWND